MTLPPDRAREQEGELPELLRVQRHKGALAADDRRQRPHRLLPVAALVEPVALLSLSWVCQSEGSRSSLSTRW